MTVNKFDDGTKELIYKFAVRMVDEIRFRAYNYEQQPDKEKKSLSILIIREKAR